MPTFAGEWRNILKSKAAVMVHSTRGGEPLALDGEKLGVLKFTWHADRYHHQWEFGADEPSIVSVESTSADAWPISPPLQQIHQQRFADGRQVVFGVGMAGRGHWSASFTLIPDLQCWIVELACRSPQEPDHLASTYQLSGQWHERQGQGIAGSHLERQLELQPIAPGSLADFESNELVIRPSSLVKPAATHQWAFRLRVP
jgi:hypothetical protein